MNNKRTRKDKKAKKKYSYHYSAQQKVSDGWYFFQGVIVSDEKIDDNSKYNKVVDKIAFINKTDINNFTILSFSFLHEI